MYNDIYCIIRVLNPYEQVSPNSCCLNLYHQKAIVGLMQVSTSETFPRPFWNYHIFKCSVQCTHCSSQIQSIVERFECTIFQRVSGLSAHPVISRRYENFIGYLLVLHNIHFVSSFTQKDRILSNSLTNFGSNIEIQPPNNTLVPLSPLWIRSTSFPTNPTPRSIPLDLIRSNNIHIIG